MFNPSFIHVWRMFWGDLNTPESYPDDWYMALTNQSSHWGWSAAAICAICVGWALVFGGMPYRVPLWFVVVALYAFWVEYLRQGWRKHDSFNDIYFVALGAAAPLVSLQEVTYRPEIRLALVEDGWGFVVWMAVVLVSFAAHVVPRIVRKLRQS